MNTREPCSVKNDQKTIHPALDYTINTIWPNAVSLSWERRSYLTRYRLSDTWTAYYNGPAIREYTITGLQPDKDYVFYIVGYDNKNDSTLQKIIRLRTRGTSFPIGTTEVSNRVIDLHWDGGDNGITLEMDGQKVGDFDPSKKSHRFTDLKPGQTYKFRGKLDYSDEWVDFDATTLRDKPTPPTFFEAYDQMPDQVSLFWNSGDVDGGTPRYRIERDEQPLEIKDRPPFIDTTPQQGRSHVYSVQTMDDQFNLSEKITVTVYFEDFTAPTDPTNLSTSHLTLTLKWDESFDSSGNVFYDVDQEGEFLGTTKEKEFAITGLDTGQRYTFGLTAKDPSDNKSNRVTVTYPPLGTPLKHQQ